VLEQGGCWTKELFILTELVGFSFVVEVDETGVIATATAYVALPAYILCHGA